MTRDLKNTSQFIQNIADVAFLGHKLHGSCCLVKVLKSLLLESSCIEKRTKKSLRHCTPLFGKAPFINLHRWNIFVSLMHCFCDVNCARSGLLFLF